LIVCTATVAFSALAWYLVKEPKDEMTENPVLAEDETAD
jgi:hypothetical protein